MTLVRLLSCFGDTYMVSLVPEHGKQSAMLRHFFNTLQTKHLSTEISDWLKQIMILMSSNSVLYAIGDRKNMKRIKYVEDSNPHRSS